MMSLVVLSGTAARSCSTNFVFGVIPASEKKKTGMFTESSTCPAANSSSVLVGGRERRQNSIRRDQDANNDGGRLLVLT